MNQDNAMNISYPQRSIAKTRQRGIAVVECAIVLPLAIFVLMAVAEIGNAILQYNTLTQAARDAARYVAADAGAGTGVIALSAAKITTAKNLVAYGTAGIGTSILPGLAPGNVTVALVNSTNVSVSISYDYQPLFGANIPGLGGAGDVNAAFTMNAEVIMRVL
jgi:Flp pilus assembly protein TadG